MLSLLFSFDMNKFVVIMISLLVFLAFSCQPQESDEITGFTSSQTTFTELDANTPTDIVLTLQGTITQPVTVDYTWVENTAFKGIDFEATDGSLTFTPDQLSQTVSFEVVGDSHLELEESLSLSLSANGKQFAVGIILLDNDRVEDILSDAEGFYTPESYASMRTLWTEEFDGSQLDPAYWTYDLGDGCPDLCDWGNNELQLYSDTEDNLKLENGRMTITARSEGNNDFTSARIITKDKLEFTYGRIDIRAKMPKGQGIWPALWLLGANIDDVSWPRCGEIDIMELVGHEPATTHATVHYENNGYTTSTSKKTLSSGDLSDQFHVYSLIWDKNKLSWFLDNERIKFFQKSDDGYPFDAPFYFILNIAVGGIWPGNPDSTTVFPQTMEVDYIRVFQ
jgi:hypothetical protein